MKNRVIMRIWTFVSFVAILWFPGRLHAAEPTVQPSNITISQLTCVDVQISWTNGNGAWRLMLMKEGGAVNDAPIDGTVGYNANSQFGLGTNIGSGNYIVMNAPFNTLKVTGLKQNTQYCIALFESDGGGSPDFLTSSPATYCFTTQNVSVDFKWSYTDSCQYTNFYQFTNLTAATFGGITYNWTFGDGQSGTGKDVNHTYDSGGLFDVTLTAVNAYKCPNNTKTSPTKIFVIPRPKSYPSEVNFDTVQCFTGNVFKFYDRTTLDNVVNTAFKRTWYFSPTDSSTIERPTKSYPSPGRRRIFFRSETLYKDNPSGCTDTTSLFIDVIADPSSGGKVNDSIQCLAGNSFIFDNTEPNILTYKWKFGPTDSVNSKTVTRSFPSVGAYYVEHSATTTIGCASRDSILVLVKPNMNAGFSVSDPSPCQFDPLVDLSPLTSGGIFSGSHLIGLQFEPIVPGNFAIKYVVGDTFCPDSSIENIRVISAPVFSLGNDTNICNGGTLTLNITRPGTVQWFDGDVSNTRNFSNSGLYWAEVSDTGCLYRDSINLFVGFEPIITWPFDTIICKKEILRLSVPKPAGTTLQWSTGSNDSVVYISMPGTYTVTAINGCGQSIGTIIVSSLDENCDMFIPNAFTPDGSGKNEVFELVARRPIHYMKFLIYDRWGTIVYDGMKANAFKWDGTMDGNEVMQGIYHYLVIYQTGEGNAKRLGTVKGFIHLLR